MATTAKLRVCSFGETKALGWGKRKCNAFGLIVTRVLLDVVEANTADLWITSNQPSSFRNLWLDCKVLWAILCRGRASCLPRSAIWRGLFQNFAGIKRTMRRVQDIVDTNVTLRADFAATKHSTANTLPMCWNELSISQQSIPTSRATSHGQSTLSGPPIQRNGPTGFFYTKLYMKPSFIWLNPCFQGSKPCFWTVNRKWTHRGGSFCFIAASRTILRPSKKEFWSIFSVCRIQKLSVCWLCKVILSSVLFWNLLTLWACIRCQHKELWLVRSAKNSRNSCIGWSNPSKRKSRR